MPDVAGKDLYHGLRQAEQTLPTSAYLDPAEYRRDLEAIWYRRWLMVCRAADIAEPLAYRVFTVGTQEVLVVRDETGILRAFHNTCRHQGDELQLEDFLGEFQRVPALPRRTQAPFPSCADLRPRSDGAP